MIPLLQNLKIGETINISTMTIESHVHPLTSIKRWFYKENRYRTMTEIEACISSNVKRPDLIISCIPGLKNLMITYQDDEICKIRLIKCIKLIECYQKAIEDGRTYTKEEISQMYYEKIKHVVVPKGYTSSDKWMDLFFAGMSAVVNHLSKKENRKRLVKDLGPYVVQTVLFPGYNNFLFLFGLKMILGKTHQIIDQK